jgi:hypothetical protein
LVVKQSSGTAYAFMMFMPLVALCFLVPASVSMFVFYCPPPLTILV